MKLAKEIENFQTENIPNMDPKVIDTFVRGIEDLKNQKIVRNALKVEDKIPSFTLPDAKGKEVSSDELLKNGPIIISFY